MLELPNFGHMTTFTLYIKSRDKFCWWRHWQKLWRHNLFFQNTFILRRPGVAIFANIIKIVTMWIKKILTDSRKVRRSKIYVIYVLNAVINADVSRTKGLCHVIHLVSGSFLGKYNCSKFHHCRILLTDFREGGLSAPHPHPWAAPKNPILNRVTS